MTGTPTACAAAAAAALLLAGCTAARTPAAAELPTAPADECNATAAQVHLGQKATGELGVELLRQTAARVLRWVPPRTAVTMDYRADRVTVGYDDDYTIVRISCG